MKEQIIEWVTAGIASVGGIAGVITILCTIIKVFGGNSVKAKLAAQKVDFNNTLHSGLDRINEDILGKVTTDITVDISAKVDKAIAEQLEEQKRINDDLRDQLNAVQSGVAEILAVESEYKVLAAERRQKLLEKSRALAEIKPVEREAKPTAHISVKAEEIVETVEPVAVEPKSKRKRVF